MLKALEINTALFGEDSPNLAVPTFNMGELSRARGRLDEAEIHFRRALELWKGALGDDHPDLAYALEGLGNVARKRGDAKTAVELLERALALREKHLAPDSYYVSGNRFALAKALALQESPTARARARELATSARAGYEAYGDPELVAEVDAWLKRVR